MTLLLARLAALALALAPVPALAQDISSEIAASGISAIRARLAALEQPTPADRFALGGLTFLGAVQSALQARYAHAFSPELNMVPVLRLPVPPNPSPKPFEAGLPAAMARDLVAGMDEARAVLAAIPEDADFGVDLRLQDLWFDIDADGRRGRGEGLLEVVGPVLFSRTGFDPNAMPADGIRFDLADSRWLAAYSALIGAGGEAVLAYDPTEAVAEVLAAKAKLADINTGRPMLNALDMNLGGLADAAVAVQRALAKEPDVAAARGARDRLLQMVHLNRDFWRLVALETDDAREWIPNDRQHSALGLEVPPGTGAVWLAVLDDAERLLNGELLVPYWRLGEGAGLNLRRMFDEPRPVDVFAWIQGIGALPYAETGTRMDPNTWRRFDQLVEGQGVMFAVLLN